MIFNHIDIELKIYVDFAADASYTNLKGHAIVCLAGELYLTKYTYTYM